MKMDKKKWMIIGGIVLAGAIAFYLYRRRSAGASEPETIDVDAVEVDDDGNVVTKSGSVSTESDNRYNTPVRSDLAWIKNKKVASYLSGLLKEGDGTRLRSWFNLINKQKVDSGGTKWKETDNLTGDVHTIGASLFQMKKQTEDNKIGGALNPKHTSPKVIWSNEVKYALQDAQ